MGAGQTRSELQAQAQAKLDDAILLLKHERYSNAYYIAGYAIEFGLKACIAVLIEAETIPNKAILKGIMSHQLMGLVALAGLGQTLKDELNNDPNFAANWAIVLEWEPDARYQQIDPASARLLISAIADSQNGVLRWIRTHW
jgi:hypothetical protein